MMDRKKRGGVGWGNRKSQKGLSEKIKPCKDPKKVIFVDE